MFQGDYFMRLIALLTALLFVAPANSQENEAEKLFKKMADKILAAKTMQIEFEREVSTKFGKLTQNGNFDLAKESKKYRIKLAGKKMGELSLLFISDGKSTYLKDEIKNKELRTDKPAEFHKNHLGMIARGCVSLLLHLHSTGLSGIPADHDINKVISVSKFELGPKEKIGDQDCQVIRFTVTLKEGNEEEASVAMWLNPKTHLPMKQTTAPKGEKKEGPGGNLLNEVLIFQTFNVDGAINPKVFELPK
jgi:outer membrane lipoprotein-sorting protein